MTESENPKRYDLEDRTFAFAQSIREHFRENKPAYLDVDDTKQLIRSSGSVAANFIEANENLSKKDFVMRIKICRKEAKESVLWTRLLKMPDTYGQEATELMKIFGAILEKCK
ncbi:MAG: four helix bundle protein [Candidatus Saccharimonadales bacterium]|jgi:four helix bundle protein|nr:four helix bundle protein [Candidatus Saccharibacteria bacterium]